MLSPRRLGASEGTAGRLASPLAGRMRCGRSNRVIRVICVDLADAGNVPPNDSILPRKLRMYARDGNAADQRWRLTERSVFVLPLRGLSVPFQRHLRRLHRI